MSNRPNILVLVSDQHHARACGYRGHPHVRTPRLDELAADGVVFTQAYSNCPVCGPARSCYMSGLYNFQTAHWSNGVPVRADLPTWSRRLADAGYHTSLIGKIDFTEPLEDAGFEHARYTFRRRPFPTYPLTQPQAWQAPGFRRALSRGLLLSAGPAKPDGCFDPYAWMGGTCGCFDRDRAATDWAIEFLQEQARQGDRPWALHVGWEYPHWPYKVPQEYFDLYWPGNVDLPFDARFPNPDLPAACREFQWWNDFGEVTEEMHLRTRAAYYGMIACLDGFIGEVIDRLKATGQYDNTYVIHTSDHGDSMGEHGLYFKLSPLEGSVSVPLLIRGPGLPRGGTVDTPVSLVDLCRTVLDIVGLDAESEARGQSWLPLAGGGTGGGEPVFSEYHGVGFRGAWYMLREGDWKYVWYEYYSPTLHNLREDPHEMQDLARRPEQARRLAEFERMLRAICNPEGVSMRAKVLTGLIRPDGRDLTADGPCYDQDVDSGTAKGSKNPTAGTR